MITSIKELIAQTEAWNHGVYRQVYKCSARLKDDTELPCVLLHSKSQYRELAKRRINEERGGNGALAGADSYGQIVAALFVDATRVPEYLIKSVSMSKYALPEHLLNQIESETTMAWTGWVFEMSDGQLFSYGSSFNFHFFQLPEGYLFSDVKKVYNHSYVDDDGNLKSLTQGGLLPDEYDKDKVYSDKIAFDCAIKDF